MRVLVLALLIAVAAATDAQAVVGPSSVTFDPVKPGSSAHATVTFTADTTDAAPEAIGTLALSGSPAFSIESDDCSGADLTGACHVTVAFAPAAAGAAAATLHLPGARGDADVPVTGAGFVVGPKLSASADRIRVDPTAPGVVAFTNVGDLAATVAAVTIEDPGPGSFSVAEDHCSGTSLAPGARCEVQVRAVASPAKGASAQLRVSLAGGETAVVLLELPGQAVPVPVGVSNPAALSWTLSIQAVRYVSRSLRLRLYTTAPATVTVSVFRGARRVLAVKRAVLPGFPSLKIAVRLVPGRYRLTVAGAVRGTTRSAAKSISIRP